MKNSENEKKRKRKIRNGCTQRSIRWQNYVTKASLCKSKWSCFVDFCCSFFIIQFIFSFFFASFKLILCTVVANDGRGGIFKRNFISGDRKTKKTFCCTIEFNLHMPRPLWKGKKKKKKMNIEQLSNIEQKKRTKKTFDYMDCVGGFGFVSDFFARGHGNLAFDRIRIQC